MDIERLIKLVSGCDASITLKPPTRQTKQNSRFGPAVARTAMLQQTRTSGEPGSLRIAMRLQYRGRERTSELSLTEDAVRELVAQAELRRIQIGDFVGELLLTVTKKDLFRHVLETHSAQERTLKRGQKTDPQ